VTNGTTQTTGDYDRRQSGGGVWCESASVVVSNCVMRGNSAGSGGGVSGGTLNNCKLTGNSASDHGGGADQSTLNNCTLTANSAYDGGGAYSGTLNNCSLMGNLASRYGGGAYPGTLNNCTLAGNSAGAGNSPGAGGGAYSGTLNDCALTGNSATFGGGGVSGATVNNCSLTGNSASYFGGATYGGILNNCTLAGNAALYFGGGAYSATLNNCIVYYNTGSLGGDNYDGGAAFNYCCTTPLPSGGTGNVTNAPRFADTNGWSNLRLQSNSPYINAGNNAYAPGPTDLDGNPRISGGTVDVGAYEFVHPASIISYTWLSQYGLRLDGSADFVDRDHDGINNWQEWIAGTNPTNFLSVLRMLSATGAASGVTVSWASVTNRSYALERATNLGPSAFSVLQSNIAGWPGTTTTWTDTGAVASARLFYRVRVQN